MNAAKTAQPNSETLSNNKQTDNDVCLAGRCPVTLVEAGKWVAGDVRFGCVHRGRTYLFADAAKRERFQQDPEKFSPILAGYDPVIFHERGELVPGDEAHGVFMGKAPDHRIILFVSQETRDQFQSDPETFMNTISLAVKETTNALR